MTAWSQQQKKTVHPLEEEIHVINDAGEPLVWKADGRPVTLEPGETDLMPRWVFHLGQKVPGNKLRELNPEEGSIEFEESQMRRLEAEQTKLDEEVRALEAERKRTKANLEKRRREIEALKAGEGDGGKAPAATRRKSKE